MKGFLWEFQDYRVNGESAKIALLTADGYF
jgi:hypothetical protein